MRIIEKLAIANRGEVSVRIIRACQELGIETVLLHSEADKDTLAYRLCDERVCIGPAPVQQSYLNIEANINGAKSVGADAIHPGFGFLSENANFAEACEQNNLIFVGPSAKSIRLFGDKISAKNLVQDLNIPTIPGYQGENQDLEHLLAKAQEVGYPLMVKAAAGGGGRGLKIVTGADGARTGIEAAQREGLSAFGSAKVFLEKYIARAKHIEVQIFGDASGHVFHLFERDCSVQRRHQKVIEESPGASLSESVRQKLLDAAVRIARKADYRGAGTVEFLVDGDEFYFMEMNTRLQVEHPVTEAVVGVDLVKAQIQTAQEQSLLWAQADLRLRGHAIECRVYAEDPYRGGIPSCGKITYCQWPVGPGRRFDCGFDIDDVVTPHYDSMLAKVIVWDETRVRAIERMKQALRETIVFGVYTNIPYLLAILEHPDFVSGEMTTRFIEQNFAKGLNLASVNSVSENFLKIIQNMSQSDPQPVVNPWFRKSGELL